MFLAVTKCEVANCLHARHLHFNQCEAIIECTIADRVDGRRHTRQGTFLECARTDPHDRRRDRHARDVAAPERVGGNALDAHWHDDVALCVPERPSVGLRHEVWHGVWR